MARTGSKIREAAKEIASTKTIISQVDTLIANGNLEEHSRCWRRRKRARGGSGRSGGGGKAMRRHPAMESKEKEVPDGRHRTSLRTRKEADGRKAI